MIHLGRNLRHLLGVVVIAACLVLFGRLSIGMLSSHPAAREHTAPLIVNEPHMVKQVNVPQPHVVNRVPEQQRIIEQEHAPPELQYLRKYGRVSGLPTAEEIKSMSDKELFHIYQSYLDNIDILCSRKLRLGKMSDGGWDVCDDVDYRPVQPCVVYSFGINWDFSFDDDVARFYGCQVYSFDPSMKRDNYKRSERVSFYRAALGAEGGRLAASSGHPANWTVLTLTAIKDMLHHHDITIDILKMDIEDTEWLALADMMEKGELTHVRQLLVEFHLHPKGSSDGPWVPENNVEIMVREAVPVLAKLEALGFRRFHSHMNHLCQQVKKDFPVRRTTCYEVYFLNTRFVRRS